MNEWDGMGWDGIGGSKMRVVGRCVLTALNSTYLLKYLPYSHLSRSIPSLSNLSLSKSRFVDYWFLALLNPSIHPSIHSS